ncbi:MAG: HU family DNA-binding protein [Bacteroidota bacterium]
MNKGDLINQIAGSAEISKADAEKALDATLETIIGALKGGDKVTLIGFGTFSISHRAERQGRNPQTNQTITIPAKNVVKFKAGKNFTDSVNG